MTSQGGNNKETERARVVHLSHVLWDNVVLPWLCPPPDYGDVAPIVLVSTDTPAAPKPIMAVLRAGEALFPLLALCCSAVTSAVARSCASSPSPPLLPSHHDVIRWCAVSRCPRSAEWILSHNRGGDGGDAATRNRMRMSIDVLTGLCWGGHIDDARSFVEKGRAWGSVRWPVPSATTTNAAPSTNSGMPQLPAVQDYCSSSSSGSSVDACTGASKISTLVGYPKELASSSEEVRLVIEEFWSESGIIRLIEGVCKGGHLEVLKWVVSSFPIGSDLWCRGALHSAIYGCHIDIIRWLTHNFPVYERDWQSLPVMKTKHVGVQAIKKLAEEFPLWVLSSTSFCSAAAGCKGSPTDEVLSVCNWFKDTFSPQDDAFLPPPGRSTIDPEIIKWIASDGNEDVIWAAWTYCYNWGIDLVKWFIEEKSVQPTENHFMLPYVGKPSFQKTFVAQNFRCQKLLLPKMIRGQNDRTLRRPIRN
ncbi:hypothetical protein Pelo_3231 [Pelomyxa schiedti]|nr:hypothetical protein Pelo_3231 [Pelomyxa schiedti]